MDFINNFPFFSIMLCMFCAIVTFVLNGRYARHLTRIVLGLVIVMSLALLIKLHISGESFVYFMGHFPAPWGNEIRAGELEAILALFVSVIAFFAVLGGLNAILEDVEEDKQNLYFILVDMMVASLLAMIYTNDLFTAYVFIEINTIAGCGLIMIRQLGKSIVTAVRYMVISLVGSGLFLIGVTLLYTITGHLLMSNIQESVAEIASHESYRTTLTVIIALMSVGLAIKSGLFPFHSWIPEAYGTSNACSSALLSSVVSKGYIFLLIKIYYRVIGIDVVRSSSVLNILYVFGVTAIILGSVLAIREKNIRKMIAYSSVAQIGYIYMGIGIGTTIGFVAAIFHIFAHGCTKALLFISSTEFTEGSHAKRYDELYGFGHKYKLSALCFSVGAFSMVGFPLLAGFISKVWFAKAGIASDGKMLATLIALALSTLLNCVYFLRAVVILYSENKRSESTGEPYLSQSVQERPARIQYFIAIVSLVVLNFVLGLAAGPIMNVIEKGLDIFN
ncbi:MAG: sodium:proton antiporter [Lachnospiraceae bacterium]|nr:sodium:proton antiporter [Lachnospiraceae bacterium]